MSADPEPVLGAGDGDRLRACVRAGGVAVFPADTVYGLCCDPEDAGAVERVYALKGRAPARPAAVMFFTLAHALAHLPELDARERAAMCALLPGGLTVLVPNRGSRFLAASAGDPGTLGVRVPALSARLAGLARTEIPVMQTSANVSGGADARTLEEVPAPLRAGADLVLDGGELPGTPSTVLDLRDYASYGDWRIVRDGAVPAKAVAAALAGVVADRER